MKLDLLVMRDSVVHGRDPKTKGKSEYRPHCEFVQHWTDQVYLLDGQGYALIQEDGFLWYSLLDFAEIPPQLVQEVMQRQQAGEAQKAEAKDWGNITRLSIRHEEDRPMFFVPAANRLLPIRTFRKKLRVGETGRVILYWDEHSADHVSKLYFSPDGTGFFRGMIRYYASAEDHNRAQADPARCGYHHHGYVDEIVPFRWNAAEASTSHSAQSLLHLSNKSLLPLCAQIVREQVQPYIENLYAGDIGARAGAHFATGSQAEFDHLARCILHSNNKLWEHSSHPQPCSVLYSRHDEYWHELVRGNCSVRVEEGASRRNVPADSSDLADTNKLLHLLARACQLRGGLWTLTQDADDRRVQCYQHYGVQHKVSVEPPSAHERAEALLRVYEWLESKVSDKERKRLLGLE